MKKETVILLGVVAVAAVGAYYLYQKSQAAKTVITQDTTNQPTTNGNQNARNNQSNSIDAGIATVNQAVDVLDKIGDQFGGW